MPERVPERTPTRPTEIQIPIHPERVLKYPTIKTLVGEHPRNRVENIIVIIDPDELLRITLESESWQDQGSTLQFLWCLSFKNREFENASWRMRETSNSRSKKTKLHDVSDLNLTPEQQNLIFQELNSLIKEENGLRSVV